jgi:hypothetical protein
MAESRSPLSRPVASVDEAIVTPAGSTIVPELQGGYRICDSQQHCRLVNSLWEAQQLVQWAEVHHQALDAGTGSLP